MGGRGLLEDDRWSMKRSGRRTTTSTTDTAGPQRQLLHWFSLQWWCWVEQIPFLSWKRGLSFVSEIYILQESWRCTTTTSTTDTAGPRRQLLQHRWPARPEPLSARCNREEETREKILEIHKPMWGAPLICYLQYRVANGIGVAEQKKFPSWIVC